MGPELTTPRCSRISWWLSEEMHMLPRFSGSKIYALKHHIDISSFSSIKKTKIHLQTITAWRIIYTRFETDLLTGCGEEDSVYSSYHYLFIFTFLLYVYAWGWGNGGQWPTFRSQFFPSTMLIWDLNSAHQLWPQAPSPTEPAHLLHWLLLFKKHVYLLSLHTLKKWRYTDTVAIFGEYKLFSKAFICTALYLFLLSTNSKNIFIFII